MGGGSGNKPLPYCSRRAGCLDTRSAVHARSDRVPEQCAGAGVSERRGAARHAGLAAAAAAPGAADRGADAVQAAEPARVRGFDGVMWAIGLCMHVCGGGSVGGSVSRDGDWTMGRGRPWRRERAGAMPISPWHQTAVWPGFSCLLEARGAEGSADGACSNRDPTPARIAGPPRAPTNVQHAGSSSGERGGGGQAGRTVFRGQRPADVHAGDGGCVRRGKGGEGGLGV